MARIMKTRIQPRPTVALQSLRKLGSVSNKTWLTHAPRSQPLTLPQTDATEVRLPIEPIAKRKRNPRQIVSTMTEMKIDCGRMRASTIVERVKRGAPDSRPPR